MSERQNASQENRSAARDGRSCAARWPANLIDPSEEPNEPCIVRFAPVVSTETSTTVALLHQVALGSTIAWENQIWTGEFESKDEARRAADWIARHQKDA